MRLIDADKVIDVILKECVEYELNYDYCSGVMDGLGKAIKIIVVQPTIEPVKRGKWVEIGQQYIHDWQMMNKCSACGHTVTNVSYGDSVIHLKYCPYCGAEMENDEE